MQFLVKNTAAHVQCERYAKCCINWRVYWTKWSCTKAWKERTNGYKFTTTGYQWCW